MSRLKETATGLWSRQSDRTEYERFGKRYWNDPAGFANDCIMWGTVENKLTAYQQEIVTQLTYKHRLCVRSMHGAGKTSLSAITILWFALTRDSLRDGSDWKIPTTASAWRQLEKFLWPEIHKWARRVNWARVGRDPFSETQELLTLSLRLGHGEAFALASDDHNLIEGAHADHMLYIFDEAKTIPEATWDAAEGAMVGAGAYWLAISTPGAPTGRFYDIHAKKPGYRDWWVRHVRLQEAVYANRVTQEWVQARATQWGEASAVYRNRVLGEFASEEDDIIIPLTWIERANDVWERWWDLHQQDVLAEPDQVGIDVARSGNDKTVFAPRFDLMCAPLLRYSKADTMETVARAGTYLRGFEKPIVIVDVIGIGAGVYDRLSEMYPYRVFPFTASESAGDLTDKSGTWRFADMRSAAWWNLKELLDPANGLEVGLPPDDDLTGDLTSVGVDYLSNGRIRVWAKDKIKELIKRSPDSGDAVVMAYFPIRSSGFEFA